MEAGHWLPRDLCMRYYISAAILIIADQLIKFWTRTTLLPGDSINVIGNFFKLTYVINKGAALNFLSGQRMILIIVPVAIIVIAGVYLIMHRGAHWTLKTALMLVMAGGFGNLIDRVLMGQVTDMFSFSIFPPVFNLADAAVTIGCALLIIYVLFGDKFKKHKRKGR